MSNMNHRQISELWKNRLLYQRDRGTRSFTDSYLVPLLPLFLSSVSANFGARTIFYLAAAYLLYLALTWLIKTAIANNEYSKKVDRRLVLLSLLGSINDVGYLTIVFMPTWLIGILELEKLTSYYNVVALIKSVLGCSFFAAILVSPFVLRMRSTSKKPAGIMGGSRLLLLLAALPGLALTLSTITNLYHPLNLAQLLTISASFLLALLFLPSLVWAICEILFLGLRKWPKVYLKNSQLVVEVES
jgi:hypothetical protein